MSENAVTDGGTDRRGMKSRRAYRTVHAQLVTTSLTKTDQVGSGEESRYWAVAGAAQLKPAHEALKKLGGGKGNNRDLGLESHLSDRRPRDINSRKSCSNKPWEARPAQPQGPWGVKHFILKWIQMGSRDGVKNLLTGGERGQNVPGDCNTRDPRCLLGREGRLEEIST